MIFKRSFSTISLSFLFVLFSLSPASCLFFRSLAFSSYVYGLDMTPSPSRLFFTLLLPFSEKHFWSSFLLGLGESHFLFHLSFQPLGMGRPFPPTRSPRGFSQSSCIPKTVPLLPLPLHPLLSSDPFFLSTLSAPFLFFFFLYTYHRFFCLRSELERGEACLPSSLRAFFSQSVSSVVPRCFISSFFFLSLSQRSKKYLIIFPLQNQITKRRDGNGEKETKARLDAQLFGLAFCFSQSG